MSPRSSPSLSPSEWRLMRALWAASDLAGGAATARQVLESVEPGTTWAYTTVKTMLERLVEKRFVARTRRKLVVVFRPKWSREDAERLAVDALKDGVFGGRSSPLVHHLIDEERLSAKDRAELRRILERSGMEFPDADQKERGGP